MTEFFTIYKSLSAESKLLFAVSFFMKGYNLRYMEKIIELLGSEEEEQRPKIVNLMELLALVLASKKENAVKLFKSEVDIKGNKVSFSLILNMLLLDHQERVRDSGINILSVMTESVVADRASNVALLNSYLLPKMASFVSTNSNELPWQYCGSFLKLLSLVLDKDNPANNSFFIANLVTYKILEHLPQLYKRHKNIKIFRISYLQLVSAIIFLTEAQVTAQVKQYEYFDVVWENFEENGSRKNIIFSICLKIFNDVESRKLLEYVEYLGEHFGPRIKSGMHESNPYIQRIMQQYRKLHADPNDEELMKGKFSDSSGGESSQEKPQPLSRPPVVVSGPNQQIKQTLDQILREESISSLPEGMKLETMPGNPNGASIDSNLLGKRVRNGE